MILSDRFQKLSEQETSFQFSSEAAIGEHIRDAFVTLWLLNENLLRESQSGKPELVDEDVQAAITGLEMELADLRRNLKKINFERLGRRNMDREAFIERCTR